MYTIPCDKRTLIFTAGSYLEGQNESAQGHITGTKNPKNERSFCEMNIHFDHFKKFPKPVTVPTQYTLAKFIELNDHRPSNTLEPRIDRDPGQIPVPVKIGLFAGIPVPVKIVKFTGIPTGILKSNFLKIQLNFLELFNILLIF